MTTTNKLDLRTCPIEELCEWVAVNMCGWTKDGTGSWLDAEGYAWTSNNDVVHPDNFRSLDSVAAVEAKAREGRLKGWDFRTAHKRGKSTHYAQWWKDGVEGAFNAPTEPEARLRACALAWEAAKP